MKTMKRLATVSAATILAVSMVAATSSFAAFATPAETTHKISVDENTASTFTVYQLLTGNFETVGSDKVIVGVKAGTNLNTSAAAISGKTPEEVAKYFETATTADIVACKTGTGTTIGKNVDKEITGLATGYYLVIENEGSNTEKVANILKIVDGDVEIVSKTGSASFEKKLKDSNDTAGTTTGWQDGADWDVGDAVPFQLKATLPENVSAYEGYYLQFHDTLDASFDVSTVDNMTLWIGEAEVKDENAYTYTVVDNGFTVTIADVKKLGATDFSEVRVEYTATLGNKATAGKTGDEVKYGSAGNVNIAYLTYSNNPSFDMYGDDDTEKEHPNTPGDEDTDDSQKDTVVVFTYITEINKVDQNGDALKGAEFTLEKKGKDGIYSTVSTLVVTDETKFSFYGLDDGDYKLTETTTPGGYNGIDPIEFTISATHTQTGSSVTLTSLTAPGLADTFDDDGNKFELTGNISTGKIATNIKNNKGAILPETGGIGTKLFYVGGGALVLASGVLLVTKRRMKNQAE